MSQSIPPEIGRIDLYKVPTGIRIKKWSWDWAPGQPPVVNYVHTGLTLKDAVQTLRLHGWIVHTWPTGARAFNGRSQHRPIRSRSQIKRKRERMTIYKNLHPGLQLCTADFAYEW